MLLHMCVESLPNSCDYATLYLQVHTSAYAHKYVCIFLLYCPSLEQNNNNHILFVYLYKFILL